MNYLWKRCKLKMEKICRLLPMLLMLLVVTVFGIIITTFV